MRRLRFEANPVAIPWVLEAGKEYDFEVGVINPSSEPARLIGSPDECGALCVSARGLPIDIPARGRGRVAVQVVSNGRGAVSGELLLYTDRPTQPNLVLKVEGTVAESESDRANTEATNL